jgi:2',3'-cyclic-nucleotide 2'-phosphodiesterase (5'-nucleotidase family)
MRSANLVRALRVAAGVWLALAAACGDGARPPTAQAPGRPVRPSLRLVLMTDLGGYLEPCGCQSRPLGGIDKAAARLHELRGDHVPTLFLAAGDLLFGAEVAGEPTLEGGDAEAALQRSWQAETLAKILGRLALTAAAPGPADLRYGAAALPGLARTSGVTVLGSGAGPATVEAGGPSGAQARDGKLVTLGGVAVGVWGLSDITGQHRDLLAEGRRLTEQLHAQGAKLVVGLLVADARSARRMAGAIAGLDFLVQGGSDSPEVLPPERIGATTLLRAAHRGHGLLVVDLTRAGDGRPGAWSDVSPWSRQVQKQALERRIADLASRVAEWERDPKVDRALLAEQQARLAQLRAELGHGVTQEHTAGNTFSARFVELGPDAPSDAETRAMVDAHNKRINQHTRETLANVLPKPVAPGEPGYVGSERCGQCHAPALAWWKDHPHGNAYATLERRDSQFNLGCVGCHVTGYNRPGGSTVAHVEALTNVGCESCHGPGSLHAQKPRVEPSKNVRKQVDRTVCVQCHNAEHSDRFAYDAYVVRLRAPGHGLPAVEAKP